MIDWAYLAFVPPMTAIAELNPSSTASPGSSSPRSRPGAMRGSRAQSSESSGSVRSQNTHLPLIVLASASSTNEWPGLLPPPAGSFIGRVYFALRTSVYMSETEYRNVRLTERAYESLQRRKREGESFSDTVERIAGERSLLDLVGVLSEGEADMMRNAIEEQNEASRERLDRFTDQVSQ